VPNSVPTKFQFVSDRELVKFLVFKIPSNWSNRCQVTFEIEALTEHVYPSLYLKKQGLEEEPEDEETMEYPTLNNFDEAFGTNPAELIYKKKMTYTTETVSEADFNYFTMAIYQNSYGMTDRRKPEFKLTVKAV
jgi:hypothetical protein